MIVACLRCHFAPPFCRAGGSGRFVPDCFLKNSSQQERYGKASSALGVATLTPEVVRGIRPEYE